MQRLLVSVLAVALAACGGDDALDAPARDRTAVARVGDATLSEAELDEALGGTPAGLDSASARRQVIEQWVSRELLVQKALELGLDEQPAVRRSLDAARRATLEAAFLDRHFAQNPSEPDEAALQAYYDAAGARLALPEPYVRAWLLRPELARAPAAASALEQVARSPIADSLFEIAAAEFSEDPEGAVALSMRFLPLGQFAALDAALGERVATAPLRNVATLRASGRPFVVAVAERAPAGSVPPLALLRPELSERLAIQRRKDDEARLLQQLRAEAQARGRLDLPTP